MSNSKSAKAPIVITGVKRAEFIDPNGTRRTRYFSATQEAFSNGACLFDTYAEAKAEDDRVAAHMTSHNQWPTRLRRGFAPYGEIVTE